MIADTCEWQQMTVDNDCRDTKKPLWHCRVFCNPGDGGKVQSETCIWAGHSDGRGYVISETFRPKPVLFWDFVVFVNLCQVQPHTHTGLS
jgi:hypothetical protein